jgi:hypothetical protein
VSQAIIAVKRRPNRKLEQLRPKLIRLERGEK